jgi:hypothetical protein
MLDSKILLKNQNLQLLMNQILTQQLVKTNVRWLLKIKNP